MLDSMSPVNASVIIQRRRLQRHHNACVLAYDEVSLLDLANSLRIWADMKLELQKIAPRLGNTLAFRTVLPAKKLLRAAKGRQYVFVNMLEGVTTYAHDGQMVETPAIESKVDFTCSVRVTRRNDGAVELKNFCYAETIFDGQAYDLSETDTVKKLNYVQWLGAGAVRMAFFGSNGALDTKEITREMMIRRVANTLGGSHPTAATSSSNSIENRFDPAVRHLMQYRMGGVPLPYFVLLKIAQDILAVSPRLLGVESNFCRL